MSPFRITKLGIFYAKYLGADTEKTAWEMTILNQEDSWTVVEDQDL